jgi:hypothetical protein
MSPSIVSHLDSALSTHKDPPLLAFCLVTSRKEAAALYKNSKQATHHINGFTPLVTSAKLHTSKTVKSNKMFHQAPPKMKTYSSQ